MEGTNTGSEPAGTFITELNSLRCRIDQLEHRLALLEGGVSIVTAPQAMAEAPENSYSGEGFGVWLNRGAVLQKLAAVCFILVFALLLRTITDYGYVNPGVGTLLGLAYVSILVGGGFWLYQHQRSLAPVFAGCGFLLLFAIVVESLNRFATLTAAQAYLILFVALTVGSFMGMRFSAARLLTVAVIGVAISGLAANFPKVFFPAAGGLLLVANLTAILAARRGVARNLTWWVTLLTFCLWALWGFKIYMTSRHGQPLEPFHIGWYLPLLLLFWGLYLAVFIEKYFRSTEVTAYTAVLPSLNSLLLFLAGRVLMVNVWEARTIFGVLAVAVAAAHVLMSWRLSVRDDGRCAAIGGSMVGGALMLAMGLPELTGGLAWAVPGWSLAAYGLARLSGRCDSAMIRVISYLYQFFGLWVGLAGGVLTSAKEGQLGASLTATLGLAIFGLAQYRWCRHHPPARQPPVAPGRERPCCGDLAALRSWRALLYDRPAAGQRCHHHLGRPRQHHALRTVTVDQPRSPGTDYPRKPLPLA